MARNIGHICDIGNKYCQEGANPNRHPEHGSHKGGCICPLHVGGDFFNYHECEYTSICCEVGVAEGTELEDANGYHSSIVVGLCGSCHENTIFECIMCEDALQKE